MCLQALVEVVHSSDGASQRQNEQLDAAAVSSQEAVAHLQERLSAMHKELAAARSAREQQLHATQAEIGALRTSLSLSTASQKATADSAAELQAALAAEQAEPCQLHSTGQQQCSPDSGAASRPGAA